MSTPLPGRDSGFACKICVAMHGLKGSEIGTLPKTQEELWDHIEKEHHIPVRRPGETELQCKERFYAANPEARSPKTCKCPECADRREREKARND